MSIANLFLLLGTFKQVYDIPIPLWVIVLCGIIGVFVVGFIDYMFIFPHENEFVNKKNDLKKQLNRIENELKK